jgi:hypothetical protein
MTGPGSTKLDADTLEDVITIDDPKTYTKPWSTRVTYRRQPGLRLKEYVCTDSNPEASRARSTCVADDMPP